MITTIMETKLIYTLIMYFVFILYVLYIIWLYFNKIIKFSSLCVYCAYYYFLAFTQNAIILVFPSLKNDYIFYILSFYS